MAKRKPTQKPPHDPRHCTQPRRKSEAQTWCTLDPGSNDIGYCIGTVGTKTQPVRVLECGNIEGKAGPGEWISRMLAICDELRRITEPYELTHVLLELPEQYAGSVKGTGASNSQAIVKLSGSAFALVQSLRYGAWDRSPVVTAIEPKRWKGQAPKPVTAARVLRAWGWSPENHNAADALALFDWLVRKHYRISPDLFDCEEAIERSLTATVTTLSLVEV